MGVALASGVSPAAGIIAAIVGGIVVGLASGAPLVVSGPAAGLAAFVFQIIEKHGLQALPYITLFAGVFQILFGVVRLGRVFLKVPKAVLEGMLAAIGISIVLGQIYVLAGQSPLGSPLQALLNLPELAANTLTSDQGITTLAIGLLTLAAMVGWQKFNKRMAWIPAALPAVLLVTLIAIPITLPRISLEPILSTMTSSVTQFSLLHTFPELATWVFTGFSLALIASAESLLTARAIDVIAQMKKSTGAPRLRLNRELMAQGLGNAASALLGGMPITGVMVRSSANINCGAHSRLSTVLHGTWMFVFVTFFLSSLNMIPLTALAAVLVLVGTKLVNIKEFMHLFKTQRMQAWQFAITTSAILATDLLIGLTLGLTSSFICYVIKRRQHSPRKFDNSINANEALSSD